MYNKIKLYYFIGQKKNNVNYIIWIFKILNRYWKKKTLEI